MLTVQPVSFKPAFKGYATDAAYNREQKSPLQEEWEGYKSEFENLSLDENLPKPMRKFAKFMKIISTAVLTALGVIWASKKAGNLSRSAYKSEFVQNSIDKGKGFFGKIKTPLKNFGMKVKNFLVEGFNKFKKTKFGQKVVEKYTKLKGSKFGKAVKYVVNKAKDGWKFIKKTFKDAKNDITFDKVNDTTANVMGTGAGVATAYDVARNDSQQEIPFDEVDE